MVKGKILSAEDLKLRGMVEVKPGVYEKMPTRLPETVTPKSIVEYYNQTGEFPDSITRVGFFVEFHVDPMGKPRMTQSDKWRKRKVTDRYWELKRQMKLIADSCHFEMPESDYHMIFNIAMPNSWSEKKKESLNGQPHKQKPDKDNLEKGVLDALCEEDSYVWDGRVTKLWAYKGSVIIKNL